MPDPTFYQPGPAMLFMTAHLPLIVNSRNGTGEEGRRKTFFDKRGHNFV